MKAKNIEIDGQLIEFADPRLNTTGIPENYIPTSDGEGGFEWKENGASEELYKTMEDVGLKVIKPEYTAFRITMTGTVTRSNVIDIDIPVDKQVRVRLDRIPSESFSKYNFCLIGEKGNEAYTKNFSFTDTDWHVVTNPTRARVAVRFDVYQNSAEKADYTIYFDSMDQTDTNGINILELKGNLERKIDKPSDAPAVGNVLKIKQINEDGSFVCEWSDEPVSPSELFKCENGVTPYSDIANALNEGKIAYLTKGGAVLYCGKIDHGMAVFYGQTALNAINLIVCTEENQWIEQTFISLPNGAKTDDLEKNKASSAFVPTTKAVYKAIEEVKESALNKKVGYSEVVNGQLLMYSDDTKAHLLATLDLPSGGNVKINGVETEDNNVPIAGSDQLGLVKILSGYGMNITSSGNVRAGVITTENYTGSSDNTVIGKGTLENIKEDLVKRSLIDDTQAEWTPDEQSAAQARLGIKTDAQTIIENHIKATPDYGTYTVRFPKWETSHTASGEKLDDNQGLILTPATDTVKEINTYPHCFDTIDVNAYVDEDGVRHITAIKGDKDFKDTGRVDVFVCLRTYWEKYWEEDGYEYYSRCYYPKEGYTINRLAVNRDGSYNPWFLIAKYMAGDILDDDSDHTHKLYSSKGLRPAHHIITPVGDEEIADQICWVGMQDIFKRRGKFYTGSLASELKHLTTSMWLYFATKNSQSIMYGYANSSFQYICAEPTENMNCFIITASQASTIDLLQCVSIGDNGRTTAPGKNEGTCHNIAYDVRVIKKETLESGNVAIWVDHAPFATTATSWISSFHEVSGYSDLILGRNGSPVSNTNGRHGMVLDGIELMVGGYEALGNVIFNATSNPLVRDMVVTNDATKLSTTVSTFINNATTLPAKSTVEKTATSQYITEVALDLENGIVINTKAGQESSGDTVGYCDRLYFDPATSGQREVLSLGGLGGGSTSGLCSVLGLVGVTYAGWDIITRLSVNAVGSELRSGV